MLISYYYHLLVLRLRFLALKDYMKTANRHEHIYAVYLIIAWVFAASVSWKAVEKPA